MSEFAGMELKVRDKCRTTYFIEISIKGIEEGVISIFTDKLERTEAIARLIAAAPALYEACKSVVLGLECLRLEESPSCKKGDACCVCQAKAALAAAEEKQ